MKKLFYLIVTGIIFSCFLSCEDDFLKKPMGSDLIEDSIFSTQQKSLSAIVLAYSNSLRAGLPVSNWDGDRTYGLISGTLSHLSGELIAVKHNWEDSWNIQRSGMTADDGTGIPRTDDGFNFNYKAIRHNYLVLENIDKVADMTLKEKDQVKAEMKTLIAYRYEEMFKRYGGVPIVPKSIAATDDVKIPRASLEDVLQHIVDLCDEAVIDLPDTYPDHYVGRATKGVALAIKAEALIYAARPLFNSSTPYMDLGENNNLICYGEKKVSRWQTAAEAAEAVLAWARNHNHDIINTGSPLDDYGNAVSTPGNREVLISYRNIINHGNNGNYFDPRGMSGSANGMSFYQLKQYLKANSEEQTWDDSEREHAYSDYKQRIEEMEPRYKASAMAAGMDPWNNPNSESWSTRRISWASTGENNGRDSEACGRRVKFWYHAGSRSWFEFPIYRLAEFYLDLAEAYNEVGNPAKALENLNVIRERAGLTNITETNQDKLRKIIQREWAVEFYEEGHRLYDVKHWKLEDIDNGIIGGPKKMFKFNYKNSSYGEVESDYLSYYVQEMYKGFWNSSQYLDPFPIKEVNKGYLVQNPGY